MKRKKQRSEENGDTAVGSDCVVPMKAFENFLRYIRTDTDVIAVKIVNEALDRGATIDQLLASESGLRLSVNTNHDKSYVFYVDLVVGNKGNVVGDGGSWQVDFDSDGNVVRALSQSRMFYD